MNKKLLLAIFSGIMVGNMAPINSQDKAQRTDEENQKIDALLMYHFNYDQRISPFGSCARTASSDCDLVIKHLKNARKLRRKAGNINSLTHQLERLSSEQMRRPVQKRLDKAQAECPDYNQKYWQTLSAEEQDALIDAAANIAEEEDNTLSYNISKLEEALNQ